MRDGKEKRVEMIGEMRSTHALQAAQQQMITDQMHATMLLQQQQQSDQLKVRRRGEVCIQCIAHCGNPSQSYGASPAIWDHTVLPAPPNTVEHALP